MGNIREIIVLSRVVLISILTIVFFIKIYLFFKYEKEWNSITFFHFNPIQLKMTVSKDLRKRRRFQNKLTSIMLILILFFGISTAFNLLIKE